MRQCTQVWREVSVLLRKHRRKHRFSWTWNVSVWFVRAEAVARNRDWILLPRGLARTRDPQRHGETCRRFTTLYGKSAAEGTPVVTPRAVNNPPMMYLSRKFRWKRRETSIQFCPRWLAPRISIYASRRYRGAHEFHRHPVSSIICSGPRG